MNNRIKMLSAKIAHHANNLTNMSESDMNTGVKPVLLYSELLKKEASDISIVEYSNNVKHGYFFNRLETLLEDVGESSPKPPNPSGSQAPKKHDIDSYLGDNGAAGYSKSAKDAMYAKALAVMGKSKKAKPGKTGKTASSDPHAGVKKLKVPTGTLQTPSGGYFIPGKAVVAGYEDMLDTGDVYLRTDKDIEDIHIKGTRPKDDASVGLKKTQTHKPVYGDDGKGGTAKYGHYDENGKLVVTNPKVKPYEVRKGQVQEESPIFGYYVAWNVSKDKNTVEREVIKYRTRREVTDASRFKLREIEMPDGSIQTIHYEKDLPEDEKVLIPHYDKELERVRLRALRKAKLLKKQGFNKVKFRLWRGKTANPSAFSDQIGPYHMGAPRQSPSDEESTYNDHAV